MIGECQIKCRVLQIERASDHWPKIQLQTLYGSVRRSSTINKGYKGYKDGLQPETLADGNWLVKQNQPVSKIETKSDTNLRSLYES